MKNKLAFLVMVTGFVLLFLGCPNPAGDTPASVAPDAPGSKPDAVVNLLAIPGVVAPVRSTAPVTSVDTDQYSGTVEWSPAVDGTFAAVTVYTATIDLKPKAGYTLKGVAENGFTVEGAKTVNNAPDSGKVTAVFPGTLLGLAMVDVPAGAFQRDGIADNVSRVSAFRIGTYEVTRAQFLAIMGNDPSDAISSSGMDDPVQKTNWYHAIAFCNKLSLMEGLAPVYAVKGVDFATLTYDAIPTINTNDDWDAVEASWTNNGYRLPTEMEWMWVAMGGTADAQGEINTAGYQLAFAGSVGADGMQDYVWFSSNSGGKSHPVGTKKANPLGLHDMSGNVCEWCWDWLPTNVKWPNYEKEGLLEDYRGPASGKYRVKRGGSCQSQEKSCTVAARYGVNPNAPVKDHGFRVVRNF